MNYCDLGFEIEMPTWLFALLILLFIAIIVLWFIATIKSIKAYRERTNKNKPKEDDLQRLLNVVNDRIIDLSNDSKGTMEAEIEKYCFHHFKGMILGLMEERKKKNDK